MIGTWWSTAPRGTRVLVGLFALHVVVKAALFTQVAHVGLTGDQVAYADAARALSNLVRDLVGLGPLHVAELKDNVVGGGWFMPGSSVLMTPLFLVDPHASIVAIRLYLALTSTLLLLVTVLSVRRTLGDLYAGVLIVLPGLIPMWLLFSAAAWGDLVAGLLATILLMRVIEMVRGLRAGTPPSLGAGVRYGLLAIVLVYARSSTVLIVIATGVVLALGSVLLLRGRDRWRAAGALALAAAAFGAVLAPWSVFASTTLDARVITTTTVPLVTANTFGDRDRVCFGPCDPIVNLGQPTGSIWFPPMQYAREVARATGRSEVEVQQQMSAYARTDETVYSYAEDVLGNAGRYFRAPASYSRFLMPSDSRHGVVHTLVVLLTDALGGLVLLGGVLAMLAVVRRTVETQVVSLLVTLSLGALLTQPFVHLCSARYWTTAAPVAALGVALLIQMADARRALPRFTAAPATMGTPAPGHVPDLTIRKWLVVAQFVLAAGAVLVTAAVVVLGRT
ncbi:MAG: hypothetical protein JWQ74_2734 [Marmoricola sp.]|nr:hypothetical protein [Marmoricola sp.]